MYHASGRKCTNSTVAHVKIFSEPKRLLLRKLFRQCRNSEIAVDVSVERGLLYMLFKNAGFAGGAHPCEKTVYE